MDLYQTLGVRPGASLAEIRRAYQKRARQLHPDLNPGDPVAAERFDAVSRAFQVLSDPERRAAYDRGDAAPAAFPPGGAKVVFEGFDFSGEVKLGRAGFREIFDGMLDPSPAPSPARGEDLEQTTRITFEESLRGTRRRVHVVRQDRCGACEGTGEVALRSFPCPRCAGTGQLRATRGHMIFSRSCSECAGRGVRAQRGCGRCAGEGRLIQSEWLDVDVPAGVTDGSRVRIPGFGNAGRGGAPNGDFVLVVEVESHDLFRREGADLECTVPVTMVEACLGAHIEVPTPDGPVTIEIPAGTQNGQRFRLRKRGAPRLGEKARGDLYVEVQVQVPTVLDTAGRRLLQELAALHPEEPRRALLARAKPLNTRT